MLARRLTMVFATLAIMAAVQPAAAQADTWYLFDWMRPVPQATDWGQLASPATAPAPRRQRVAAVIAPEPVRRPPIRILVVGIGF